MISILSQEEKGWTDAELQLGKLLLAVSVLQTFIEDNWTSAYSRHSAIPTALRNHLRRNQRRHASVLAVHARPVPEVDLEGDDVIAAGVCIRRKKLSHAWKLMQSCDADLWTDVCDLHALVNAVESDPNKYEGIPDILDEVNEAKSLMENVELLSAVETIEEYNQMDWKLKKSPSFVRRASMLMVHDQDSEESFTVARLARSFEHAEAWEKMKSCGKDKWCSVCLFHEKQKKSKILKAEKLDAACWVLQDFNSKAWSSGLHGKTSYPRSMKHAATLVVHVPPTAPPPNEGTAYTTHRKRLAEAWATMKEAGQEEWQGACNVHEKSLMSNASQTTPVRNGVAGHAA